MSRDIHISTRDVPPRTLWALEQSGLPPLLAKLYAARGVQSRDELDDSLAKLLPPSGLLGIDTAATLLADAIEKQQHICIVADYDCDGATACAVALRGLRLLGAQHVDYLVPNRVVDGYGLTPSISERVAATGANVLITVDNGIASITGVARAKELGLTVIVTDHHLPVAETPAADAIVNPNQHGCTFASKAMAGVGVMFYTLLATRSEMRERGLYETSPQPKPQPRLDGLLPLVALGTVADVVKLDANNRRLVSQGLRRIRAGNLPVGMAALFAVAGRKSFAATTADFGFALAPRINAAGRLSDMRLGIECLMTDDTARANELAKMLDNINRERREIEGGMRDQALAIAEGLLDLSEEPPSAISVFDPDFHEGVVGIVASRLKDQWHRPTFVFAPSGAEGKEHELKGSGRSIAGFHLRDALDLVAKQHPDLLLRFGGHAMAAGCTIDEESFELFDRALQKVASSWLDQETLQRRLQTDGSLPASECRVDVAESLNREVWGQGFAAPVFCDTVEVMSQRIVGEKHLALKLKHQGVPVEGIWFNRIEPLQSPASLAYRLEADEWQGNKRIKWMIEAEQATPSP